MKNFITIILLAVHLFNLAGYSIFFRYLQQRSSEQTLQHIERGAYSDDELVLVKVPVLLPYSANWKDYERYDGEIEWGGVHYNYVKRKITDDTLYVLCLPDKKRTELNEARIAYARQVNDLPSSSDKSGDNSAKKMFFEKECVRKDNLFSLERLAMPDEPHYSIFSSALTQGYTDCIIQPPDRVLS